MQSDRAKQFLPFDSLKGFKEMLLLAEKTKENRKDLLEDECNLLNQMIFEKQLMIKDFHNIRYLLYLFLLYFLNT